MVVLAISGCGSPDPVQVTGSVSGVSIALEVEQPAAGAQAASLLLTDRAGRPVGGAAVVASATMPQMGHAGQVVTGSALGGGRYALRGDLFPMAGRWDVRIRVDLRTGPARTPAASSARTETVEAVLPIVIG